MDALKDLIVPIAGVLLSGIVAIVVARMQVKAASQKLDLEYRRKATDLLFQKRMEVYPKFYSLLLGVIKKRWAEGLKSEDLSELISEFDSWEIENAIYVSPLGLEKMRRSRILFQEILEQVKDEKTLSKNKMKKILPEIYSLQMVLKTELGVIDADSFHNPEVIKHFNEIISFESQPARSNEKA
jgi:hypothetical protein